MSHSKTSAHTSTSSSSHYSSVPQLEYRLFESSCAAALGNESSSELDCLRPSAVDYGSDSGPTSSGHRSNGTLNYPLSRAEYASSSRTPADKEHSPSGYQPTDFEPAQGQPRHPVRPRPGSHPNAISAFPWNGPSNAPATSINGGTFIGNLNNIQPHGETGEFRWYPILR
jgi:hypothetical protein